MSQIPQNIKEAVDLYVSRRIPAGGFTTSVLENDLAGAVGRADAVSYAHLKEIVAYVHWEIPGDCHGSREAVKSWLSVGRDESIMRSLDRESEFFRAHGR